MKKKVSWLIVLIALCITTVSAGERIKGNGNIITKTIPVDEFTDLRLGERIQSRSIGFDFFKRSKKSFPIFNYSQTSGNSSLTITTDENLFDYIDIEQTDGKIRIKAQGDNLEVNPTKLVIEGKSKQLQKVNISGTMNFIVENLLDVPDVSFSISGVGDIKISEIVCDHLRCDISGVGNIYLDGKVKAAEYYVSGVGKVKAYDCEVDDLKCDMSGVGNMEVLALKNISSNTSGVGSVKYRGDAVVSNSVASGIGRIKRVN